MPLSSWITCQLGAREHYAIPRALHGADLLAALLTDYWQAPGSFLSINRLNDRWHPDLADAHVHSANTSLLTFELLSRLKGRRDWPIIMARNQWFQQWASRKLSAMPDPGSPTVCFAYSYAARSILQAARRRGWMTILGQIDPGPEEERLTAAQAHRAPEWAAHWSPAPAAYWKAWREEIDLADQIVVNSLWSRQCLIKDGVPESKIRVIPLAFDPPPQTVSPTTTPPAGEKLASAPFRVLYLGQAHVRKGIHDLMAAAELMQNEPFQFDIVGPHARLPSRLPAAVRFHGPVPRSEVSAWYQQADIFILPTHSDGFALTQLEAMAHGLPVITTPCCGDVVQDGHNGWLIPPGQPEAIVETLRRAARASESARASMSAAARQTAEKFRVSSLVSALQSLRENST